MTEDLTAKFRKALADLVGSSDKEELIAMRYAISLIDTGPTDKQPMLAAIDLLIETAE